MQSSKEYQEEIRKPSSHTRSTPAGCEAGIKSVSVASFPNREKDHAVCLNKDGTNRTEASRPEPSAPRLCRSQFQRPRALRRTTAIFNKPACFCFCIQLSRERQYRGKQAMIKDSEKKIKVQLPGYVPRPVNIEPSSTAPVDPSTNSVETPSRPSQHERRSGLSITPQ